MRQGELLALPWRDVDLEAGTVQVRATLQRMPDGFVFAEPKTPRSRRQVALTEAALVSPRRHRVVQSSERLRLGPAWEDNDLVFTDGDGGPIDGTNLSRSSFYRLLERTGLPRSRFHDLRHTATTLMLQQGVHPKIAAAMLGHSNMAVTLDLYSHVTATMQRQATLALDAILRT
jgi:integrase